MKHVMQYALYVIQIIDIEETRVTKTWNLDKWSRMLLGKRQDTINVLKI